MKYIYESSQENLAGQYYHRKDKMASRAPAHLG
jgi:hypothetical protein